MKKLTAGIAAVLMVLLLAAGCAGAPKAVERDPNVEYELVVLHTNDHHGSIEAKNNVGGLAARSTYINEVRSAHPDVLLIDAGDINTGSAVSNMFKAEPDIEAYNLMGYQAVTLGNHEFDSDLATLEKQMALADFPFLAANVKKADGSYLAQPYVVIDYDGYRVGVFGLTTNRSLTIASPDKSLTFINEIEAGKEMVDRLRNYEKADIVIALTHIGMVEEAEGQVTSQKLAAAVPGIDLIVDGHSHSYVEQPVVVNDTPIVSANEWGKYVGTGIFTIKDGKVESFTWEAQPINTETETMFAPDPAIVALLAPYIDEANASLKQVVATAAEKFEFGDRLSRKKEIALGDLVSDGTVWYVKSKGVDVDFAFQNGGNIRTELPAGDITKEQIATVLPFDNYIYVLSLKGSDIIALFDFIATVPQGAGGFPQMSKEARYTVNYNTGKIENLTIGGKPVDPDKIYKVATNDYLAEGGDGYEVLKRSVDTYNTSMTLRDAIIDYVMQLPQPLVPATDGRITIIGGMEL